MSTLLDFRRAIDELQVLFTEGRLSKASYLLSKRALNANAVRSVISRAKEVSTEDLTREATEADMLSALKAAERHLGW